ncbi:cilia BBSome complex subunit 10 [Ochromonadaceae sp. CCMP2298]|nr:cilia BBSome complex subunit 10 [Ochromonadaceae sp. CCMP2298]
MDKRDLIKEVLPKSGLVYSEKGGLAEILCKPKILPLKSAVLEQLQRIEQAAEVNADAKDD